MKISFRELTLPHHFRMKQFHATSLQPAGRVNTETVKKKGTDRRKNTSRAGGQGRREILSGLLEKNRSRTRAQTAFTMATVRMSKCASSRTQQRIKHRGILRAASTRRHLVTKASGNGSGTTVVEAKKVRRNRHNSGLNSFSFLSNLNMY